MCFLFATSVCVCAELSGGEEEEDEAESGGWEEEWSKRQASCV